MVQEMVAHNLESLQKTVLLLQETFAKGGLVYVAGAGHSLVSVMESFFRAGGLVTVRPLWHSSVLPLRGALFATEAERTAYLGSGVVEASEVNENDVVIVFSNSGINFYPVEVAQESSKRGAKVVAVTSRVASDAAPLRCGVRLYEVADIVIDTLVPAGDVTWPVDDPVTAPVSSIFNVTIWNLLLVGLVSSDVDVPVWRSSNLVGNDSYNKILVAKYAGQVPEIVAGLGGDG